VFEDIVTRRNVNSGRGWTRFLQMFAHLAPLPGGVSRVVGMKNTDELMRRISPMVNRVETVDIHELPPVHHVPIKIRLNDKAQKHHDDMKNDMITEVGPDILTADNVLVKTLRMRQITGGFIPNDDGDNLGYISSDKLDAVSEVVESIGSQNVVIFYAFRAEGELLADEFDAYVINGGKNEVSEWKKNGGVLVAQIRSAAEGLNLTNARHAIFYSNTYSLGTYEQALARFVRPGADVNQRVVFYHIIARQTIDEVIDDVLRQKADVIERTMSFLQ
jgi:SNF2 family DNA or RNA helicase